MPADTSMHDSTPVGDVVARAAAAAEARRARVTAHAPDAATRAAHARMRRRDREMIPKPLLYAMAGIALASLTLVSYARITDRPLEGVPEMLPVVAERALSFTRTDDGRVRVAEDGVELALMPGRSAGFLDAYTSALARKREVTRVDPAAPVRVALFEDGRVVVIDPETDWRVDPRSFGRDSAGAFAAFLQAPVGVASAGLATE